MQAGLDKMRQIIREQEPLRPSHQTQHAGRRGPDGHRAESAGRSAALVALRFAEIWTGS